MSGEQHHFHKLLQQETKTPVEEALVAAIMLLSLDRYSHLTPEQVFDALVDEFDTAFGARADASMPFLSMLYRRILLMEKSVINKIDRLEKTQLAQSTALSRLQDDNALLTKKLTEQQTALALLASAQTAAFSRFQADLDALKAAGNNEAALNEVAASMETTLAGMQTVTDGLNAAAGVAAGEDQPATPPPPPPPPATTLAVSPKTATVAAGNTVQFSANVPVKWSAGAGTIDGTGLYTPPPDPTVTSDMVTATATDGTTDSASVTITQ